MGKQPNQPLNVDMNTFLTQQQGPQPEDQLKHQLANMFVNLTNN